MSDLPFPQSIDAEKGVLGSILLSPDKALPICLHHEITSKFFHHPAHGVIFDSLLSMRTDEQAIDFITLTQHLEDNSTLEKCGGAAAVTGLFTFVPTASNLSYYLDILKEKHHLRELIVACSDFSIRGYTEQSSPDTLILEAEKVFTGIREGMVRAAKVTRKQLLSDYLDEKEMIATRKKQPEVLPCPLETITNRVGGYVPGEVTIIMGPTNSGKSLLGMEHVLLGCLDRGYPSAIFTGEMPFKQYMDRIVCNRTRISSKVLRCGILDAGASKKFMNFNCMMGDVALEIFDQKRNKLTLESIESEIRLLKKSMGLRIVLIDYLQRLNIGKRKDMRRDEELGYATVMFKRLAVDLDMWIFLLSSTNDEGQVRDSRGPEYDADNILSVCTDKNKVTREVFIPKWRDGEKSYSIPVEIEGEFCSFRERSVAVKAS